jgi:hypothetical protein
MHVIYMLMAESQTDDTELDSGDNLIIPAPSTAVKIKGADYVVVGYRGNSEKTDVYVRPFEKQMECPICGNELLHHDTFGRFALHQDGKKLGDIYKCETCNENNIDCLYHTYGNSDLRPGMPC